MLSVLFSLLQGQDFRATITGQFMDSSKSAILGAMVRAIRTGTNESTQAITNRDGHYTVPFLDPDKYVLEVSAPGFKSLKLENVIVMVVDKLNLPLTLE